MSTITSPRCNLLQEDDSYEKPSSYYRRGNLLSNTTSSFREKCKRGFISTRSRSSSYTSLDDEKPEFLIEPQTTSFFSRKKVIERSSTTSSFEDDEDAFLFENKKFSRQRSSSWKSNMLKAVGVKSK